MTTAEMIRNARKATGESQAVFAKRFGVHQSTIHKWETDGPPAEGPAAILIQQLVASVTAAKDRAAVSQPSQQVEA